MKPKAASGDAAAASPVRSAGAPRFQLASSPPQQKLHTARQPQGGSPRTAAAQVQPRSLFAVDAAGAATSHAEHTEGAGDPSVQPPTSDADPIELWGARLHSSPREEAATGCATADSTAVASVQDNHLRATSNASIDPLDSQWSGPRQTNGTAAAAAQAAPCPAAQPAAAQPPEEAAACAAGGQQRGAAGSAAGTVPTQNGDWMPSSMDQVS